MRIIPLAAVITLAWTLSDVADGVAQTGWPGSWPTQSYFGYRAMGQPTNTFGASPSIMGERVLGQTLRPGPLRFGGAIPPSQAALAAARDLPFGGALPTWSAAVLSGGAAASTNLPPQPMNVALPTGYPSYMMPAPFVVSAPQTAATPPVAGTPQGTTAATAQAEGQTAAQSAAQATVAPGPTGPTLPGPHRWPGMATSATRAVVGPLVPLPEVSARVTRLARAGGVYTPSGITVSLGNGFAVVQGTVGAAGDRALISNLVALEPGIWQVDNQLTVLGGMPASGAPRR